MAVTIFHRVNNRVKIINKASKEEVEQNILAKFSGRKHARRVTKDVRR